MDIPGNLGASSVPPLPARDIGDLGKPNLEGSSNKKEMVLTAPRQQEIYNILIWILKSLITLTS